MGELLLGAVALVLLFEGLLPLVSPRSWRAMFERATQLSDGQLRFVGLACVAFGLVLLVLVALWR